MDVSLSKLCVWVFIVWCAGGWFDTMSVPLFFREGGREGYKMGGCRSRCCGNAIALLECHGSAQASPWPRPSSACSYFNFFLFWGAAPPTPASRKSASGLPTPSPQPLSSQSVFCPWLSKPCGDNQLFAQGPSFPEQLDKKNNGLLHMK